MVNKYIENNGFVEERFHNYVEAPTFLETTEGFGGRMKGNEFYFYKKYPRIRNSFRTVMYCDIIDDKIYYRYGKMRGVKPFILFADMAFLVFCCVMAHGLINGTRPFNIVIPVLLVVFIICGILTFLAFHYFSSEKESLYNHLLLVNGERSGSIVEKAHMHTENNMGKVILSADGDRHIYLVPKEVSDNLKKYCDDFLNWMKNDPEAEDYRRDGILDYNEEDFVKYLNERVFPDRPSEEIKNLGYTENGNVLPDEYSKYPWYNF